MGAANPASAEQAETSRNLATFSAEQYAAFAALCVERLRPLLTHFFGDDLEASATLEVLWQRAEARSVDAQRATRLRERYESTIGELYDNDETGYPMYAVKALSAALCKLSPRDWDRADDVSVNACDAVHFANVQRPGPIEEEAQWQLEAATTIRAMGCVRRADVEALNAPPRWLVELIQRR